MALNKTMTFDLELKPGGIPPIVHASQGDIGRMFKANIYWDGSAATSYISGATVNLRGRKPDKTVFDYSATLSGSMVTFETTEQMTIISGPVECELVFSNDGDVIASANFVLIVEESPYNPDALSESDVNTLGELVSDQIPPAVGEWLDDNIGTNAALSEVINDATDAYLDENGVTVYWDDVANKPEIESAIEYEYEPVAPSTYLDFLYKNSGLSYLGEITADAGQDATDFISLEGLYGLFRIVPHTVKFGLGALCYYNENKQFIRRDLLGTQYDFAIYNGETGVWIEPDSTLTNAKYIRYCGDNNRGFMYWEVRYGGVATVLNKYSKAQFYNKKIVNFGDSIIGATRPPKDVSSYLAEITGATVYNAGFGGCEMSTHADANYNPFSMCNLADAIATGTWTTQETAAGASGMPAYFAKTVAMLKALDFSTVDIITIAYGTNDWNNSTPLDNGGNTNKTYFADALRYSIETILTAFPNLKVFICTPIYRFFMNSQGGFVDDSNTHINSTTNTKLTDFVNKTEEVASEYQLTCINNYNIGINKFDRSHYFYPTDGTHPNPTGNKLIAEHIAHELF